MYLLRFLSAKDLEKFRDLIKNRVLHWLDSWTFSSISASASVSVEMRSFDMAEIEKGESISSVDPASPAFFVLVPIIDWGNLVWGEYDRTCPKDEFASRVKAEAKAAFFKEIFDAQVAASESLIRPNAFSDGVVIQIDFEALGKVLVYTRQSFIARALDVRRAIFPKPKAGGRLEAIKSMRFSTEVVLSLGGFSLREVSSLSLGQTIESKRSMTNEFKLRIHGKDVLDVAIGKRDEHLAALVKGKSK
jgi:hypothetical protein